MLCYVTSHHIHPDNRERERDSDRQFQDRHIHRYNINILWIYYHNQHILISRIYHHSFQPLSRCQSPLRPSADVYSRGGGNFVSRWKPKVGWSTHVLRFRILISLFRMIILTESYWLIFVSWVENDQPEMETVKNPVPWQATKHST